MPRHFSEEERETIKQKLLVVTKDLIEHNGIKATSIDKIVENIGISKGSFYNFYHSKESLIYNIILDIEEQMHVEEMFNLKSALRNSEFPDALFYTVWKSLNKLEEEPILKVINDSEVIYKILSNITLEERQRGDFQNNIRVLAFNDTATAYGYYMTVNMSTFNSILISFFTMYVNKNMLGENCDEAMIAIIKSTLKSIFLKLEDEQYIK